VISVSGPSGVGKTRFLLRLIPALTARGLRVAALKHTRHPHSFDLPGKDTDLFRRAGALATAIAGPNGVAFFGPPVQGPGALLGLLPPVDVILAEGFRSAPLPRIEVHRRSVSSYFLCERDPRVFVVVGEERPPRAVPVFGPDEAEGVADLLCRRFRLPLPPKGLRGRRPMRSVPRGPCRSGLFEARSERAAPGRSTMPKTTSGRRAGRTTKRSRSDAGRKGGRATLRSRGPEFFSEIGRKGGRSRARKVSAAARAGGRGRGAPRTSSGKPRGRGRPRIR